MTTFSSSPAADCARCTAVNVLPALWFELTTASVRGLPAPSSTMRLVRRTRNASTSSMPEPLGIFASTGSPVIRVTSAVSSVWEKRSPM